MQAQEIPKQKKPTNICEIFVYTHPTSKNFEYALDTQAQEEEKVN